MAQAQQKWYSLWGEVSIYVPSEDAHQNLSARLNSVSFAWSPQVDHFGRMSEYSVLVFDNRGVGNSGVPRGPYTYVPIPCLARLRTLPVP